MALEIADTGVFWLQFDESSDVRSSVDGVPGTLTIDKNGNVKLDLIGTFPGRTGWDGVFRVAVPSGATIYGMLKNHGNQVLLKEIAARGGKGGHGIEYEVFVARYALISSKPITVSTCDELHIPLAGHEAWSCPGMQSSENVEGQLRVTMSPSAERTYKTHLGDLSYECGVANVGVQMRHSATACLTSSLTLKMKSAVDVQGVYSIYRGLQDLILVLSNLSELKEWPVVRIAATGADATFFFQRHGEPEKRKDAHSVWVSFDDIAEEFGNIFDRFFEQKALLGPGLHLFLGTKRSMPMYVEHRFVNMAWGLEALHRRVHGDNFTVNQNLLTKIARIRGAIEMASWNSNSDKRWILRKLENSMEPSLADRIEHLISGIGLDADTGALKDFSGRCAALRNDLSHFGGERNPGSYESVVDEYAKYGHALGHLYHLLLLARIGVPISLLREIVDRPLLFVRQGLEAVGLARAVDAHHVA